MSKMAREQLKVAAERTVLVHVQLPGAWQDPVDPFRELRALAETAGAVPVGELQQKRSKPERKTYLGKGKVEELARLVELTEASLVIFDNDLAPSQIRSIEEVAKVKIIDRSELILDIFANRATTHAAKLQVEIAQLEYTYPRLRAMWDHLGQIVGGAPVGIGTRGPGEQQLEIDRRLAQRRLQQLRNELSGIQARKAREVEARNVEHFTVGLVGYTNAGKSTLFNRVTSGGAYAHGKLFATLATRTERWELGGGEYALLSDTVGFIRNLPHHLVASFRSTLEETIAADLLLVVLDASDDTAEMQYETVQATLEEIGAGAAPRFLVLNKMDRLDAASDELVWFNRHPEGIAISAASGAGIEALTAAVRAHAIGPLREVELEIPARSGRVLSTVERATEVLQRDWVDAEARLRVRIGRRQMARLQAQGQPFRVDGEEPVTAVPRIWDELPRDDAPVRIPPHARFHPEALTPAPHGGADAPDS